MSRISLTTICKTIILNPHVPLRARLKALSEMRTPSVRFLERVLSDTTLPPSKQSTSFRWHHDRGATSSSRGCRYPRKARMSIPIENSPLYRLKIPHP